MGELVGTTSPFDQQETSIVAITSGTLTSPAARALTRHLTRASRLPELVIFPVSTNAPAQARATRSVRDAPRPVRLTVRTAGWIGFAK